MPAARRALTQEELPRTKDAFKSPRDRLLFILGLATGYRISELLSLRIKDVYENGRPREQIEVVKANTKQKRAGRLCYLHPYARAALAEYYSAINCVPVEHYLFHAPSSTYRPLSRRQALRTLKAAFAAADISGFTGTHSLRKTYAQSIFSLSKHNLYAVQKALGHADINSTVNYLGSVDEELKHLVTTRKLF